MLFFSFKEARKWNMGHGFDYIDCEIINDAGTFSVGETYDAIIGIFQADGSIVFCTRGEASREFCFRFASQRTPPAPKWWSLWTQKPVNEADVFVANFQGDEEACCRELDKRRPKNPDIIAKAGKHKPSSP